jgi:2-dehydropantoate 2-reductase
MGQKMIKNITIYGAGAIGGWLGARLAGVGCSVSVVARGATLAALQQNGLQLVEAQRPGRAGRARPGGHRRQGPGLPDVARAIAPLLGPTPSCSPP